MGKRQKRNKKVRVQAQHLRIHPLAQREVVRSHLRRMVATLNIDAIGTVHAVYCTINGVLAYWVIDGQHRIMALLAHGFGEWEVDVEVHDCANDAEASQMFLDLNARAALRPFDRFRNEVQAGDPDAVGAYKSAERHGFTVAKGSAEGSICAVTALKKLFAVDGGRALDLTLSTITEAWGRDAAAVEGQILAGIGSLYATFNGRVDQAALAKKLKKYPGGPGGLTGAAKGLKQVRGLPMARCVEQVVLDAYNRGRRSGKLGD